MKLFCPTLLFISAVLVSRPVAGSVALTHLVSDRSAVIVSIHDFPSVLTRWEQSPWAKTWNDDQVKLFFAPLRAQMNADDWNTKVKEKTGYTLSEILAFATGDAIMVLPDFDFARTTPPSTPHLLLAVEVGENAGKLEALLIKESAEEKATDETTNFSGVVVHSLHPPESATGPSHTPTVWAITEGKFFFSPAKDSVLAALDALHNGGVSGSWDQSERYARLQQRAPDSQIVLSINAEAIYPGLKEILNDRKKASGTNGMDPNALLVALGLDSWREIYAAVHFEENQTELHGGTTYSEPRGLIKLLAYHDGPPPMPPLASPKWAGVSSNKFSLKEAFAALEEILENFNPAISGMVQGQLRAMNKKLGVDLKRDLLGSLGDSMITANVTLHEAADGVNSAPEMSQFFAVSLENQDAFLRAVDALRHSMGPDSDPLFKTREYLGEKIVSFISGRPGTKSAREIDYAITKGFVLVSVGSASPIETALQCLIGHQPTMWDKPDVKELIAQLPSNASGFQYQDLRQMVNTVFQSLASASLLMKSAPTPRPVDAAEPGTQAPEQISAGRNAMVNPSAMPDAATIAKYWDHTWGYVQRDSSGIYFTSQIVYPK